MLMKDIDKEELRATIEQMKAPALAMAAVTAAAAAELRDRLLEYGFTPDQVMEILVAQAGRSG
jgi:Fe2+ transport system protein FeoA